MNRNPVLFDRPGERNPPASGRVPYTPSTHPHRGMKPDKATLDKLHGIAAAVASCLPAGVDLNAALKSEERK